MEVMNGRGGHCWGCGGVGHRIAECPKRSLLVARADGSSFRGPFGGGLKRGGDTWRVHLRVRGGRFGEVACYGM